MIAEPRAALTVGCVKLLPRSGHRTGFRQTQFGGVTCTRSIITVGNVPQVVRNA